MKHANIIFGQAVVQRNYEHMQTQERTNAKLITDYDVVNMLFPVFFNWGW